VTTNNETVKPAKPELTNEQIGAIARAVADAVKHSNKSNELRHKSNLAHAEAALVYANAILAPASLGDAMRKLMADRFSAEFRDAYPGSKDAKAKAMSRVKSTAVKAFEAGATTADEVVALGTQTKADKAAAETRKGGAMPAGLAEPARNIVVDNVADFDPVVSALAAFIELCEGQHVVGKTARGTAQLNTLVPAAKMALRAVAAKANAGE
jgi:hypothetical protein